MATTTFRGELIAPGDPTYDAARAIWNGAIDRRPALIARCRDAHDVADALKLRARARARGRRSAAAGTASAATRSATTGW